MLLRGRFDRLSGRVPTPADSAPVRLLLHYALVQASLQALILAGAASPTWACSRTGPSERARPTKWGAGSNARGRKASTSRAPTATTSTGASIDGGRWGQMGGFSIKMVPGNQ